MPTTNSNLFVFQGMGGAVHLPKGYLKGAYELIRERGGVCIADEVWLVNRCSSFISFM